jgi:diguanylate cyclase (GGDEF)-like protein/PAS domain S-box-containing protein
MPAPFPLVSRDSALPSPPPRPTDEHGALLRYLRDKVNQLLRVLGTWPLKPEELDDATLINLDPIGIIAESFAQILEHQRRTNADLSLAHEEIRAIFEAVGAGVVVLDAERRIQAYNAWAREYFFAEVAEDVQGRGLAEIGERAPVPAMELIEGAFAAGRGFEHPDFPFGERHFHVVGSPVLDDGGSVSKLVLLYTDVSERIRAELSLRDAQDRLETIVGSVPAGILVIDAETHCVAEANAWAVDLLGYPREQLIGSVCHKFVCPAEMGACPVTDCGEACHSSERMLLRSDGSQVPVVKTVTSVELSGRRYLLESFIDISQRKRAESALQESEERYRSLYTTMKEGVALHRMLFDPDGQPADYVVVDVNPAYEEILDLPREKAIGASGIRLYGEGQPRYMDIFARVVRSGEPVTFETSFRGRTFYISVVRPAAEQFATIFDDVTDRKRAEAQIQEMAFSDMLTGLPNRLLLLERLRDTLARAHRDGSRLAVLFLDLDRFKPINDTMGHNMGDALLKAVAARLRDCVRASDTVARLGGDEFVVLLPEIRRELDATRAARDILARLSEPFVCEGHEMFTTLSVGIALYPRDGRDADTLLKSADMAMYVAKERGRDTYQFYSDDMNRAARERLELETSLRRALKQDEFFLCYQPQLELGVGAITGVEALLRWHHPEQGPVPPARFIPVCEETGLILPLGEWVLRHACVQARAWIDAGLSAGRMAVNLSGLQFKRNDLVRMVAGVLEETGLPAEHLELELTESMIMREVESTVRTLQGLKGMGVRLAIDDFGTGYSSLAYLSSFPIDRIKIAQRFVRDIPQDPNDAAIVETILAMARSLGMEAIAEGVETREQVEFLWSRGCTQVQGYYFARPIQGDTLTSCFRDWLHPGCVCPVGLA